MGDFLAETTDLLRRTPGVLQALLGNLPESWGPAPGAGGKRLSLQHHELKDEWIHVLSGRLLLSLANDEGVVEDRELGPGDGAHVPVLRTHRYTAIETATLIEVSTPELDDVVRIQDDFGREGTSAP